MNKQPFLYNCLTLSIKGAENEAAKGTDKVCIYDGITLFILDPAFKEHLKNNSGRYRLIGSYDYETGTRLETFTGRFRNFDIYTAANSTGYGVVIGGSLHKWKNRTHNYDKFYWRDFIQVYKEILEEFKFNPEKTLIWVLEGGLNNTLLPHWNYKASNFPRNTILLKGEPKSSKTKKHTKGAASLHIEKGSCTNKLYDKGKQNNLDYELLRTECSCKRKSLIKIGINSFEDLLDDNKHHKLGKQLIKTFDTLLLSQPEILVHPDMTMEDKMFLLEYNNSLAWITLRKESDYQYQIKRKKYLNLIDKYAEVNYQKEILLQMQKQLQ
jgi:hypothetical protein